MVFAKCKSDPVVSFALTLLFDRFDISLFLEHLGVLGHVLWGFERIEIAHVGISIKYRYKWRRDLSKTGEGEVGKEGKSLNVCKCGHSIFGMGNKTDFEPLRRREDETAYRTTASQAVSVKLKMRSSGRSYTGRRRTLCQLFKFAQVSSGVEPENGGKP